MKKFKILAAIAVMLLAVLAFASCASNVTAYAPGSRVSLVYSELESTQAERVAYNNIVNAVKSYIGSDCRTITDDLRQTNFEIVVGESNREATRLAKEYLANHMEIDGDTEAYVFYYKDNTIAVVASSDFCMEIAAKKFIESYVTGDTLVVKSDMIDFRQFSKTAYLAERDAEITASEEYEWEHRWDALRNIIGNAGVEAMQRLYNFWGTEWLEWVAGLYDPAYGGFYYSASSRDYYGFEPDIESTAQILNLLSEFGLYNWYSGYWAGSLPQEFRDALGNFVQPMQSEADGYFYHPQWGTGIGTAAKGRHLDQAIYILGVAGVSPLYRTPMQRQETAMIGDTSDVIAAFMDTDEHKSSVVYTASTLPDYMQSEAALIAYLEDLWNVKYYDGPSGRNSWGFGHELSSQASQLKASGLIDVVCDWLDEHQIPETGYWEEITPSNPDSGYRAISGVIKISSIYGNAGRPFAHAEEMVDTAIDIILDTRAPSNACYIYNPLGGFKSILQSIKRAGIDTTAARQKFFFKLPEIIESVIEKQKVFRKELGSFSYTPERSDPSSQGLRMGLGYAEGDVNGTAVSMHYVCDALYGIFGLSDFVPMFRYADYKWFFEYIAESGSPLKQTLKLDDIDFEDGEIGRITHADLTDFRVDVVDSGRDDPDNTKALQIRAGGSASARFTVAMETAIVPTCTSYEMDIKFVSTKYTGRQFELVLDRRNPDRTAFHLQFSTDADGNISVYQMIYPNADQLSDVLFSAKVGEWFNLRVEYYPISSSEMRVKLYLNGVCIQIIDTPHNNHYDQYVYNGMNRLYFSCFGGNEATVMFDNIKCHHDPSKQFDGSDYLLPPVTEE